uniref:Procollagen C-endopeptidase enhancer a n=1 Tax=Neogobius melanostomus TaxID=47308 RepID=A0A8C6UGR6_9GOBI
MMYKSCICGLTFLSALLGWTRSQETAPSRPVFTCGGDLVADSVSSGARLFQTTTSPEGNVITLSFRIFDLEADSQCRYDYLDVYNSHSHLVQKLGRFCGTFRPGNLISTTNTMMLEMVADEATQGRGFVAYFSSTKPYVDEQQTCGGKITKAQGEIMTPNWPDNKYPPGTSCSWLIAVEPDMVIQVKFDKFALEADTYCRFDYVAFYNGGERDDSQLIGKYCGDKAPVPIITSGNVLLVQFVSDLSVTSDGFLAMYTSLPRGSSVASEVSQTNTRTIPSAPEVRPRQPAITTTREVAPPPPAPTEPPKPVKPTRGRGAGSSPVSTPNGRNPGTRNPLCVKACKRDGTIKPSFCSSEFVITGKISSVSPGPRGTVNVGVSLITTYKSGRLIISQVGETMSVKLVSQCRKCPLLRKGANYIIMGQVDADGRGTLAPGAFTAPFRPQHHKLLMNINNQPC